MSDSYIKINDLSFRISTGHPITFEGKHSGRILSGIKLKVSVVGNEAISQIDELFTCERVQVDDPFVNRIYEATIRRTSLSYQNEQPERHYVAEVKEMDLPPVFEILEIEGNEFPVLKYIATDVDKDEVGHRVLLKLSREQFVTLNQLIKLGEISMRRIGVDEQPLKVRFGRYEYWSEHEEDNEKYYKKIVWFFPPETKQRTKLDLALGTAQDNLADMVFALSVRFKVLIEKLKETGALTDEICSDLMNDDWELLLDKTRIDELQWQLDRVQDAGDEFD